MDIFGIKRKCEKKIRKKAEVPSFPLEFFFSLLVALKNRKKILIHFMISPTRRSPRIQNQSQPNALAHKCNEPC